SAIATFPHRVNNVATIDGYYRRPWLMELLGCICKRKFTTDIHLIKSIKRVLQKGDVLCMYPEARYSPCGTLAILPDSLGKLVKMMKVPVVVMLHHGNYLYTPFWNYRKPRKNVPLYTTVEKILTAEEVSSLSVEEINEKIKSAMQYDEYKWQKEQNIVIDEPFRAEGLHKILYKCPACEAEDMASEGTKLYCKTCGKVWEMTELGELKAESGETEFSHIPDWYEWERSEVREEILRGEYSFEDEVEIYSLPRPMSFTKIGMGRLTHDPERGFVISGEYNGERYEIERHPSGMYGVHIEYDYCYLRPEDCIDISTDKDSFYCYPEKQNVVTKLSLATEEIFKLHMEKVNREKVKK
ncbi:MAG: hypothetical protein J6V50_05450, partial [Clostridia bacterium]|nr:hypothetical protein [Clostridia bacterium]